jgi:hypothetical protein
MSQIISIEFPDYLANAMRMNKVDFDQTVKVSSLVKMFELGKVSSGVAAKVLNISRIDFFELLGKNHVSFFDDNEINDDFENA